MPLELEQIEAAAQFLKSARLQNRQVDGIPPDCRPGNLQEAYAVQDKLVELLGWEVGGWFGACTNTSIQDMLGLAEPYYARLFKRRILPAPAVLQSSDFPPIVLECEFGFRLAKDLPSRSLEYSREDVEAAVGEVHPTIEVVAGYLKNWTEQEVWSVIADNGTDGALVHGDGCRNWQELDLVNMAVTLEVNGEAVREGSGARVLGDPMSAFVWLANARSRDGAGLKAGDIHNTGTATEIFWVTPGDRATARFHGLGEVSLHIAA